MEMAKKNKSKDNYFQVKSSLNEEILSLKDRSIVVFFKAPPPPHLHLQARTANCFLGYIHNTLLNGFNALFYTVMKI